MQTPKEGLSHKGNRSGQSTDRFRSPPHSAELCQATFGDLKHNSTKFSRPRAYQKKRIKLFTDSQSACYDGEMSSKGGMIKNTIPPNDAPNPHRCIHCRDAPAGARLLVANPDYLHLARGEGSLGSVTLLPLTVVGRGHASHTTAK